MVDELKKSLKNEEAILFIGAGIPATLGLPTWSKLIAHIARELGYDERLFKQYGDSLQLAEYYMLNKGRIGELRSWMDSNWKIEEAKIKASDIYESITKLNCPIIYTTNYDHSLEDAFRIFGKPYKKITGIEDLVGLKKEETQIIKFHGDTIDDSSIVLTESSYFNRLDFESPLDIKLRSDMLGKSIIFIGYSLSDINVRFLIYKLNQLWKDSNKISQRPKSYLFLATPNPIQEKILESRGIITIVGESPDREKSLAKFLRDLI